MADSKAPFKTRTGEVRRRDIVARLAGEKVDKELANYRPGKGAKICFECINYETPGSDVSACRRVTGPVEARDVCDIFTDATYNQPGALSRETEKTAANIKVQITL